MKKLILAFVLIVASSSFITTEAQHINVNINIGSQPAWGPVGYDYVEYYYIPEINVYYHVPTCMFHYWNGGRGRWVSARYLPYSYRNYDLYRTYKVVINDRNPWYNNRYHTKYYKQYKGYRNQKVIYYSNDHRYRDSKRNRVAWYNDNGVNNSRYEYRNNKKNYNKKNDRYSTENRDYRIDKKRNSDKRTRNTTTKSNKQKRNVNSGIGMQRNNSSQYYVQINKSNKDNGSEKRSSRTDSRKRSSNGRNR